MISFKEYVKRVDEAKLQRLPGESDDDFLTRRDKIRAKAGTLGGISNQQPVSRGARNSTEVRSEYSDMIHKAKLRKNESEELDESASRFIQKVNQAANAAASGKHKNAQMHLDNARSFMLGVKSTDMEKIKDAHETYKNLRKKYSGSGGNFTPSHNQVGNAKVSESEELDEAETKVDHALGHKIAKNLGTKLKTFAHGRYKTNNSVIPGNIVYTFHDDKVTHKDVHAALVKSGFKAPRHTDVMHDHEEMKSWTNSAVSPTHTAHTSQEHGGPLKLHIQARDVSESALVEAIKGWKHAHTDIMKSRAAASAASKPIQLRRLTAKGEESKMSSGEQTAFSSHEDAQKHVDNMHQMNPGKKFSYNKYENGKHVGVVTKSTNESVELDEATFVSDSPATYGSRGTKFEVKKNKEKSVGEHANGQPKEHHDVYHEGKHIGHVSSYSGYKDKKPAGSRIVTSRKDVRLWQATVHGGEHNRHGSVFNTTPAGSQYFQTGFASKKDALQHLADAHNSNKNR